MERERKKKIKGNESETETKTYVLRGTETVERSGASVASAGDPWFKFRWKSNFFSDSKSIFSSLASDGRTQQCIGRQYIWISTLTDQMNQSLRQ